MILTNQMAFIEKCEKNTTDNDKAFVFHHLYHNVIIKFNIWSNIPVHLSIFAIYVEKNARRSQIERNLLNTSSAFLGRNGSMSLTMSLHTFSIGFRSALLEGHCKTFSWGCCLSHAVITRDMWIGELSCTK